MPRQVRSRADIPGFLEDLERERREAYEYWVTGADCFVGIIPSEQMRARGLQASVTNLRGFPCIRVLYLVPSTAEWIGHQIHFRYGSYPFWCRLFEDEHVSVLAPGTGNGSQEVAHLPMTGGIQVVRAGGVDVLTIVVHPELATLKQLMRVQHMAGTDLEIHERFEAPYYIPEREGGDIAP